MIVQNVMFPKEDWESMDDAKAWLKEHEDLMKLFEMAFAVIKVNAEPKIKIFETKEGRILSEKNRQLLQECTQMLMKTGNMLQELLDSTERDDGKSADKIEPDIKDNTLTLENVSAKALDILQKNNKQKKIDEIMDRKFDEMRKKGIVQV